MSASTPRKQTAVAERRLSVASAILRGTYERSDMSTPSHNTRVLRITGARSASSGGSFAIPGLYDAVLTDADGSVRAEFFDLTRSQVVVIANEWGAAIEGDAPYGDSAAAAMLHAMREPEDV
jgi:hypothetical protein